MGRHGTGRDRLRHGRCRRGAYMRVSLPSRRVVGRQPGSRRARCGGRISSATLRGRPQSLATDGGAARTCGSLKNHPAAPSAVSQDWPPAPLARPRATASLPPSPARRRSCAPAARRSGLATNKLSIPSSPHTSPTRRPPRGWRGPPSAPLTMAIRSTSLEGHAPRCTPRRQGLSHAGQG